MGLLFRDDRQSSRIKCGVSKCSLPSKENRTDRSSNDCYCEWVKVFATLERRETIAWHYVMDQHLKSRSVQYSKYKHNRVILKLLACLETSPKCSSGDTSYGSSLRIGDVLPDFPDWTQILIPETECSKIADILQLCSRTDSITYFSADSPNATEFKASSAAHN